MKNNKQEIKAPCPHIYGLIGYVEDPSDRMHHPASPDNRNGIFVFECKVEGCESKVERMGILFIS